MAVPLLLIQLVTTWAFYQRHWKTLADRLSFAVAGEIRMILDVSEALPEGQNSHPFLDNFRAALTLSTEILPANRPALPPQKPMNDAYSLSDIINKLSNFGNGIPPVKPALESNPPVSNLPPSEYPLSTDCPLNPIVSWLTNPLASALRARTGYPFCIQERPKLEGVVVAIYLPDRDVQVTVPYKRLFSSTSYIFLLWMAGSSVVFLAIALVFLRNQVRPIQRLAKAAEWFGKGRPIPERFKPEGALEVRQAAHAFLNMRDRINRQIAQRTFMLAGISHDLRTPLTRMRLQLAMMAANDRTNALLDDVVEMQRMVDGYLDYVRGEGGEASIAVRLDLLLLEVIESLPEYSHIPIDVSNLAEITVLIRPTAMRRAWKNLLSNAARYGKAMWVSTNVVDTADDTGRLFQLIIDDNGDGIPEDMRTEVFKPFFRLEPSRNLSTGGIGLGLAIAQDIITSHGGNITLDDSPHGGLRVVVVLPI